MEEQLALAARRGDRSAVLFGSAHEVPAQPPGGSRGRRASRWPSRRARHRRHSRARLAATARAAGMAVCGAGCMGFVNVTRGLRAVGYVEPDPLPAGPVALITHSGSVFSALLRTRRALGFTVAVSSGQELVTTAAQYAEYALSLPETRVLALVLEAIREPGRLRAVLATARERRIPVVMLTAGRSAGGRALVSAHSGALATADGGWEALAAAYGVHRVGDLAEMADTLELFALTGSTSPRPAPARPPCALPTSAPPTSAPPTSPRQPRPPPTPTPPAPPITSTRQTVPAPYCAPASRPCTIPGWSGLTWPTWPTSWASRSRRSARRPRRGWPPCSTRAWRPPTRSTCGAPVPARKNSCPARWPRWPTTRRCTRWRSPSTWCTSSTGTSPTRSR